MRRLAGPHLAFASSHSAFASLHSPFAGLHRALTGLHRAFAGFHSSWGGLHLAEGSLQMARYGLHTAWFRELSPWKADHEARSPKRGASSVANLLMISPTRSGPERSLSRAVAAVAFVAKRV